ncbi:MAG: ribonuclease E/G, partial [Lachnospira sp.]|nr:ribonuclease E/G [Lachnospira sp.]
ELLPLKSLYSLERELEHGLNSKVWLRCGGYIVIEQTEALTAIDVNTGKFVTKKGDKESKDITHLKVNIEAAQEIARQLRLRNLTGIIIIDFINMQSDFHTTKLLEYLKFVIKNDTVICNVVDITKLGLVEMTRQKNGKSLKELMSDGE